MFVRQDITIAQQAIQSLHAIYQMAQNYRPDYAVPNVVFVGVPSETSLQKVLAKLKYNQIPHFKWIEPDEDLGFTSIATIPLNNEEKEVLSNYRLWKFIPGAQSNLLGASQLTREPDLGGQNAELV